MAAPTSQQIKRAYRISANAIEGNLKTSEAISAISVALGANKSSSGTLLHVVKKLRTGERFTRRLTASHLAVVLDCIRSDLGQEGLESALAAIWAHIDYYEAKSGSVCHQYRELASHRAADWLGTLDRAEADFQRQVRSAQNDSVAERRKRLAGAARSPKRRLILALGYVRNADVVAERLHLAKEGLIKS